jgi:membrane associated rhomboid family serine protease
VLVVLLTLVILPELILQLADAGLMGPRFLRPLAYMLGSFQPDLHAGPGPFFPFQTLAMFFTYGFLHTGLLHLAINAAGLWWLGQWILARRRPGSLVLLYLMSMVGAAEVFALLGPPGDTMVGASGALFGLFGVYAADAGFFGSADVAPGPPQVVRLGLATLALVISDVLSQWLLGSPVAWQAHAGGFLTGAVLALISPPQEALA